MEAFGHEEAIARLPKARSQVARERARAKTKAENEVAILRLRTVKMKSELGISPTMTLFLSILAQIAAQMRT